MKIHRQGYPTILLMLAVTAVIAFGLLFTAMPVAVKVTLWVALLLFFLFIVSFFRLPVRISSPKSGEVLSSCDGRVVVIEEVEEPEYFRDRRIQISVFMSPANVHVNWAPIRGLVTYVRYHAGKYLVASHPKSSTLNERTTLVFKDASGHEVLLRQVAGMVARRVVYFVKEGQPVNYNDEIGFIKFGSRIDIYLPLTSEVKVKVGDKITGNQTVLALLPH